MKKIDYSIFILSHGRPDNIKTLKALEKSGNTKPVFIIVDDKDNSLNDYKKKYKNLIVFSKDKYKNSTDTGDNFTGQNIVVFARNACFDLADKNNIKYFIVLDDDYESFSYTYNENSDFCQKRIKNIDNIFTAMFNFQIKTDSLTVATSQRGDFLGGADNDIIRGEKFKRKAMNSFFCITKKRFDFMGRINEDVNMYLLNGKLGHKIFQVPYVGLNQTTTQQNKGGLTDVYLELGTYQKSFYSLMYAPSCVRIRTMGHFHLRLHHNISWKHAVPKIISEELKK